MIPSKKNLVISVGLVLALTISTMTILAQDNSVVKAELDYSEYETYSQALIDQVEAGDGNGIDNFFRNSGVVIDEEADAYYAVNGVHPVNRGNYDSYYPKSIVMVSLETDEILRVYSFDTLNGHATDMEGLSFAEDTMTLYIGDEYNLIYELDLESGDITREWNLAEIGISTQIDKGIEALTYSSETGYFYAGIQEQSRILVLDLHLEEGDIQISLIDDFDVNSPPSGLFAHADGSIYVLTIGGGRNSSQKIFRFEANGTLLCEITIPTALGITRPDGVYIDAGDAYIYIADSQGTLNGGASLYKLVWTNPCNSD